ncbi:MAG TPA: efflux RND transporter permease subunit [Aquabacterium sp.]|uniref:efflux RND transporter permease subunit n=1 Tax=Aquabacterium sp. TaxID=1872578 RepID=UPI002E3344E2|nr:efflux RND transporter permease subunit [Aquabacterium sp.]HEX5371168.1 efflux RND transporter permease subunit [Aquabacterium sp.]
MTSNSSHTPDDRPSTFNLSRWALEHKALTRYLMVALMLLGLAAFFQLGQDEDPPFAFRIMVVRSYWPGASAQVMAEQVTDKIERTLQEVPHVDKVRSYSKPGETYSLLLLKDSTPPKEVPDIWYQTRKKVNDMRHTLPQGVLGPFFNDEFGDVYGSIYALSADGFSDEELRQYADKVRGQFLHMPDVAKVELFGVQPEKIFVEIPQFRLAQMGLDLNYVIGQLNAQNGIEGAGVYSGDQNTVQMRVTGAFNTVEHIRAMPLRVINPVNGQARTVRLGDVATVRRAYENPPVTKVHHQGKEVLAIGISMAKGGDIIALGKRLQQTAAEIKADLPVGIELEQIQNQPEAVSHSVGDFLQVLIEAVVVVLGVSFVSLGLHTRPLRLDIWPGMVVAITIPLVLAVTFLVMYFWGVGLHKISLGALIIALGLLVDDAIIAVEMMVHKLEEGYDKVRAATAAYEITAMPMLTGTLITAAGFLPIGLANSAVGEYTFAIFAVTAAALIISWVVSVYFVPYLGQWLLKTKPKVAPGEGAQLDLYDTPFYGRFKRLVNWCVEYRWTTIGLTLVCLALGVVGMGKVQQQFFPDSSRPEVLVDLWLPEGSSFEATERTTRRFEERMLKHPDVKMVSSWVGAGVPRFYLPLDQIFPQSNVAQVIVVPKDAAARERVRHELPRLVDAEFPEVRARVKLLPNGPPVPYPVQFRIVGDDISQLRHWADEAKAIMRLHPDMHGVNDNWNESIKAIRLDVDQAKARALGVTTHSIAQASRVLTSGVTVGQYREDDRTIDIVLRSPQSERVTLGALDNAYVPTASGRMVPVLQVAKPKLVWEPGVIWREGRRFAITVQGDVSDGVQGPTVSTALWPQLTELQKKMPAGYRVELAGTAEESSKGQGSIIAKMPIMLFIIFTLLMLQLQSFSRAMLVFLTGPMGIAGVAASLLLLNRPFGFVAMLGVIALMGMIMRNSVILIDQIESDRSAGMPAWNAIVGAAVRRFRPIVLTAAAAVLAMIPLTRSAFWGPMAVAIMGGLIVATALTLLALPAMYAAWFRVRRPGSAA